MYFYLQALSALQHSLERSPVTETALPDTMTTPHTDTNTSSTNLADSNTVPTDTNSSLPNVADMRTASNTVEETSRGGEECPLPLTSLHPPPPTSHHPPPPTSTTAEIRDYVDHLPQMTLPWQPLRSITRCNCGRVFSYLASKVSSDIITMTIIIRKEDSVLFRGQ